MNRHWLRTLALIAVLMLAVAACGDDDADPGDTEPAATSPSEQTTDEEMSDEDMSDEDMSDDEMTDDGPSMAPGATVSVAGEEFVLENETVCVTMGGAFGAQFANADRTVTFDVDLPPESWDGTGDDWEPASVRFDDDREDAPHSWRAGGVVLEGMDNVPPEVTVTGFSVDGSTATGTATVVDLQALMTGDTQTSELTFSVTCG